MIKNLQKKFVLLTTTISLIVLFVIVVLMNTVNYISLLNNSDELLELLLESDLRLAESSRPPDRFPRELAFTTRFFVLRSDEDDAIHYIDTKNISSVSTEMAIAYAEAINSQGTYAGTLDDYRFAKTENQYGYTYIFLDIEEEMQGFRQYLVYSVLIMTGATAFIFILSCLFSKRAVKPVAMAYEKQKQFITDVSHEFKTPLSIIKTNCEVVEITHGEDEWVDGVKMQTDRLNLLVENLLSLTKLDEASDKPIKTDFSLDEALVETMDAFSSAMQQRNLHVQTHISKNISLNATEDAIRTLFSILIENAIKYAPQGSTISAELFKKGNKKVLLIQNDCENVSAGRHDNWFDRFYREDEARGDASGFGIGLSIAKSICDNNAAKITAESKRNNHITITVIF